MKKLRLLLFPFGFLYGIITAVRNLLYDRGIKKTYHIPVKSICVGNLSVGGTGKTPHVAYLAAMLSPASDTAILSRGYGRKTTGYILLDDTSTSGQVGDEPLFYYSNFKSRVRVAVCESRQKGTENLLSTGATDVLLLDDAFQHRAVSAGLNILLTDYSHPYYSDLMLPAGNLREWASGRKRADIVIVTKCPPLDENRKHTTRKRLKFAPEHIYFSEIVYGALVPFRPAQQEPMENVLLVTGIANPEPLEKHLRKQFHVELMKFPDHHVFTLEDIQQIHKKFDTFAGGRKAIITTEKDYMRLLELENSSGMHEFPWFYQSITVRIDREKDFKAEIDNYVRAI